MPPIGLPDVVFELEGVLLPGHKQEVFLRVEREAGLPDLPAPDDELLDADDLFAQHVVLEGPDVHRAFYVPKVVRRYVYSDGLLEEPVYVDRTELLDDRPAHLCVVGVEEVVDLLLERAVRRFDRLLHLLRARARHYELEAIAHAKEGVVVQGDERRGRQERPARVRIDDGARNGPGAPAPQRRLLVLRRGATTAPPSCR